MEVKDEEALKEMENMENVMNEMKEKYEKHIEGIISQNKRTIEEMNKNFVLKKKEFQV